MRPLFAGPFPRRGGPPRGANVLLRVAIVADRLRPVVQEVQRVTLWASLFVIVLQQMSTAIGRTVPWLSFATYVQNLVRSFH